MKQKKFLVLIRLLLFALLLALVLAAPAAAQEPDAEIQLSFHAGFGIQPGGVQTVSSGGTATTAFSITDVEDLYGINLAFDYNGDVVQVADIVPGTLFAGLVEGVDYFIDVKPATGGYAAPLDPLNEPPIFFPFTTRRTYVNISLINYNLPPVRGNGTLIEVHWNVQHQPVGTFTPIALTIAHPVDEFGNKIEPCLGILPCFNWPDAVDPAPLPPTLPGLFPFVGGITVGSPVVGSEFQVALQGGKSPVAAPPVVVEGITTANLNFTINPTPPDRVHIPFTPPYNNLTISRKGYLGAAGTQVTPSGLVTLMAGDVNEDNVINIFDIATVASVLNTPVVPATEHLDYNADGSITIVDLALVAQNFGTYGPQLIH